MTKYNFDLVHDMEGGPSANVAEALAKCSGKLVDYVEVGPSGGNPSFWVEVEDSVQFEKILKSWGFEDQEEYRDVEEVVEKGKDMKEEVMLEVLRQLAEVSKELAEIKAAAAFVPASNNDVPRNQRPGVAKAGNFYLYTGPMAMTSLVPQQQRDIAEIIQRNFKANEKFSEADLFAALIDHCGEYRSLYESVQDVTYLFKYYRGLPDKNRRCGYILRGWLKQF